MLQKQAFDAAGSLFASATLRKALPKTQHR
jgi:hypothetical protein